MASISRIRTDNNDYYSLRTCACEDTYYYNPVTNIDKTNDLTITGKINDVNNELKTWLNNYLINEGIHNIIIPEFKKVMQSIDTKIDKDMMI